MQKPPKVTRFNLGAETDVDTIRELVEQIKGIDGSARVSFTAERGQRDESYTFIIITETDW